jgi:hypothetical protein
VSSPQAAIVTAIYDAYDTVKPVCAQAGLDVEWVLVTDTEPEPCEALAGWRVVVDPRPGVPPVRAAKAPKVEPWRYTAAPASVWVDGSFRVVSDRFAADVLALADPIAQFGHPWRDCLYQEASAVGAAGLDPDGAAAEQVDRYLLAHHPEWWGLWATGVIARRHTPEVRAMGAAWAQEIAGGCARDQVSQPFVLRAHGLRPTALPGDHMTNRWLKYEGSARHERGSSR